MSDSKTFPGVTEQVFQCVKATSNREHGTVYDPPDGNKGTATTDTVVGKVVMGFDLDTSTNEITYTIISKPGLAPKSKIWGGIQSTIEGCQ